MNSYKILLFAGMISILTIELNANKLLPASIDSSEEELFVLANLAHNNKDIAQGFHAISQLLSQDTLTQSEIEKVTPQFTTCKNLINIIEQSIQQKQYMQYLQQQENNEQEEALQIEEKPVKKDLGYFLRAKIRADEEYKYNKHKHMQQIAQQRRAEKQQKKSIR